MRKNILKPTLFLGLACAVSRIQAQEVKDTSNAKELELLTVSVKRTEEQPITSPRSVDVITPEEIQNSGTTSVAELLSQETGISIMGTNQTPGSQQSVFLRGANSNHTVIMIDGMRITDPSGTNNAINLAELNLNNVERIEIVRGSHSTMYGTGAIGGVINIITKSKDKKTGFHVNAGVNGGVFNGNAIEASENVTLNYTTKKGLYGNLAITNKNVTGFDATIDNIEVPIDSIYRSQDQDAFNQVDLQAKIGKQSKKSDFYVLYKKLIQTAQIDDGAYIDDDNRMLNTSRDMFAGQFKYMPSEKFAFTIKGNYSLMGRQDIDDSSAVDANATFFDASYSDTKSNGSMYTGEAQINYKLKNVKIVGGLGVYGETMNSSIYSLSAWGLYESETPTYSTSILNVYANADIKGSLLSEKLKTAGMIVGGRINQSSQFGFHPTFQINPYYEMKKKGVVYANVSTGFNAPSLYQTFTPFRGDSTLKAENSTTIELGYKKKFSKKLTTTVSLYQTKTKNIVDYVYLWDGSKQIDSLGFLDYFGDAYVNLGTQTINGLEFSFKYDPSKKISVAGNVNLIAGNVVVNPSNLSQASFAHIQLFESGLFLSETRTLENITRRNHTANLSISHKPKKDHKVSLLARYVGKRTDVSYDYSLGPFGAQDNSTIVNDFMIFDIVSNHKISDKMKLGVKVCNLLNSDYQEILGYNTRKRGLFFNLNYKL